MFVLCSNTFGIVQENASLLWKMQRYHLVKEFQLKLVLAPPLILIAHIYLIVRWTSLFLLLR